MDLFQEDQIVEKPFVVYVLEQEKLAMKLLELVGYVFLIVPEENADSILFVEHVVEIVLKSIMKIIVAMWKPTNAKCAHQIVVQENVVLFQMDAEKVVVFAMN